MSLFPAGRVADLHKLFRVSEGTRNAVLQGSPPNLQDEIVAFVRPSEAAAAAEYARLTGRSCVGFESIGAALKNRRVAVLVVPFSELSSDALEAVANSALEADRTAVVGLVLTTDAAGRPFDHTVFATAYRLSLIAPPGPRTMLCSWLPGEVYETDGEGLLLGTEAEPPLISAALTRDNALTMFLGHSDGIDLQVASGKIMCGVRDWHAGEAGQVMPRCAQRSWCHRRRVPMAEALLAPEIIGPELVRSRVVLLASCFGLPFSDRLFHRRFSLFNAILTRSEFGALVTHCAVTFVDMENSERAGDALCHPAGIGRGIRTHLISTQAWGHGPVLIGDPALVLKTRTRLMDAGDPCDHKSVTPRPVLSLNNLAGALLAEMIGERFEDGVAVQDVLLDWLVEGDIMEQFWQPLFGLSAPSDGPACAGCGSHTRLFASCTGALPCERQLVLCPVCGVVADRPSTETVLLTYEPGSGYRLSADFVQPVRAARLRFEQAESSNAARTYSYRSVRWPILADGVPKRSLRCSDLPPGMNRITAFFLHDEDITVLTLVRVV